MRIREYQSRDFHELWRLDQECFAPGIAYSRVELMHYIRRRGAFTLIAENDDARIGGFLVAECHHGVRLRVQGIGNVGHVLTIDVAPTARRQGIGMRLMAAAETRIRQQACEAIYLETAVDNAAGIAFYKRLGYSVLSTIPRYYNHRLDALVMGKKLRASPPLATE